MLFKKIIKMQAQSQSQSVLTPKTREYLWKIEDKKREIIERSKKLIVADNLKLLDFSNKDERGFVEYYPGVFVRDITSIIGAELGKTDLHVMVKTDVKIDPHEHITQSQTIMVIAGKIKDMLDDNRDEYRKGESFFIRPSRKHLLKYFAGSQYLITFMPQLEEK
jgi:hypothetical protein